MPTQSQNYQLWVGMVSDDLLEPAHVERTNRTVDRVLGKLMRDLLSNAAYTGWLLQEDETVSAGEGLVAGCWCETAADQAVTGLTHGAVNYVFAVAGAASAPEGTVAFAAQTNPVGPAGAVYLGTIELDAGGEVVEVDSQAEGAQRGAFALLADTLSGSGGEAEVEGEATVEVEISHDDLAVPGAISFTVGEDFSFVLNETWRGDGFMATVTNTDTAAHDLEYTWSRQGIRG